MHATWPVNFVFLNLMITCTNFKAPHYILFSIGLHFLSLTPIPLSVPLRTPTTFDLPIVWCSEGRAAITQRVGLSGCRNLSPGRGKNFRFSMSSIPPLGSTQRPIQWVPGDLSPGVKRQGREADNSPPASAEVKKTWIYTPLAHTSSWRSA
jgi:hypothetical protein